jgi:hypothetical protein
VANQTTKEVNVAGQQITDGAGKITSQGEQLARNTINSVSSIGVSAAGQAKIGYNRHGMWTAKVADAALNDIDAGSKLLSEPWNKVLVLVCMVWLRGGELMAEWVQGQLLPDWC